MCDADTSLATGSGCQEELQARRHAPRGNEIGTTAELAAMEAEFANKINVLESEVQRLHALLHEERDASRVLKTALEEKHKASSKPSSPLQVLSATPVPGSLEAAAAAKVPPRAITVGIRQGAGIRGATAALAAEESAAEAALAVLAATQQGEALRAIASASAEENQEQQSPQARDAVESAASAAVKRLRSMNDHGGAAVAERILSAMRGCSSSNGGKARAVSEDATAPAGATALAKPVGRTETVIITSTRSAEAARLSKTHS